MALLTEMRRDGRSTLSGFLWLLTYFLAACLTAYFWQGVVQHHWWTADYIASLAIPLAMLPLFIWFAFVPRRIRYNSEMLEFTSRFTGVHVLPFAKMKCWGSFRGVTALQFDKNVLHRRTLQMMLLFYTRDARDSFMRFLKENYSDRYTENWIGITGLPDSRN